MFIQFQSTESIAHMNPSSAASSGSDLSLDLGLEVIDEIERRRQSLEILPRTEDGDIIFWDSCSREFFDQVSDRLEESDGKIPRLEYIDGRIIISELDTSPAHETGSRCCCSVVGMYNHNRTGSIDIPLAAVGSAGYNLHDRRRSCVAPDEQFTVPGRPGPNLVVEVGHSQSLRSLCNKADGYLRYSENIMLVAVVKIYENRALLFLLYQRSIFGRLLTDEEAVRPSLALSFGPVAMTRDQVQEFTKCTGMAAGHLRGYYANNQHKDPPCLGLGQALYQVSFPHHLLLSGDNLGEVDEAYMAFGDMETDLYELQDAILVEMPEA